MIWEINYDPMDLIQGICEGCGEESGEIDPNTGMCVDCIEAERFYQESMRTKPKYF